MRTRAFVSRGFVWTLALAATAWLSAGCAFFQELESIESAEDGTGEEADTDTGTEGDDDGEPCTLADDTCDDQDTVRSCDLAEGDVTIHDCGALCGQNTNFTCVDVGTGQHGCWCVAPGTQKVYSCSELEDCLFGCGDGPDDLCTNQCFARTTAATVRMYGALVFCAHSGCESVCEENPAQCAGCIDQALSGESAGCQLERSVCDVDRNDEPWP
jgi:hypothetical protein